MDRLPFLESSVSRQHRDSRATPPPNVRVPLIGGGPGGGYKLVGQIRIGRVRVGSWGQRGGNRVTQCATLHLAKAESHQRLVQAYPMFAHDI